MARPWAAARPTRRPVKLPGPQSTRIASGRRPASTVSIIGSSRSAWPRPTISCAAPSTAPSAPSRATEQAAVALSITRSMGPPRRCAAPGKGSDGLDRNHLGHIMFEQALDPVLQRHRRGRAALAGAVQGEKDGAVPEAAIDDVAAVLRHSGTDAGVDQLANLGDDLGIGGI